MLAFKIWLCVWFIGYILAFTLGGRNLFWWRVFEVLTFLGLLSISAYTLLSL